MNELIRLIGIYSMPADIPQGKICLVKLKHVLIAKIKHQVNMDHLIHTHLLKHSNIICFATSYEPKLWVCHLIPQQTQPFFREKTKPNHLRPKDNSKINLCKSQYFSTKTTLLS